MCGTQVGQECEDMQASAFDMGAGRFGRLLVKWMQKLALPLPAVQPQLAQVSYCKLSEGDN